jgi:hypothetical protein
MDLIKLFNLCFLSSPFFLNSEVSTLKLLLAIVFGNNSIVNAAPSGSGMPNGVGIKITEQEILCEIHEDNKPAAIPPINVVEPSIRDSIFKFSLLLLELIILSSLLDKIIRLRSRLDRTLELLSVLEPGRDIYPFNNKNIINTNIFSPRSKSI